jgi:tRNA modification GTPase
VASSSTTDTIVAIATPRGRGALGVVRVSGPDAVRIVVGVLDGDGALEPRRATFARIAASERTRDEVVVTWFPAPRSYTGDDCVEVSAHGAPVVLDAIVDAMVARGARRAGPGEFTLRAFVNGRVDLTQAEAVADLTSAVTAGQARAAFEQLEGRLGGAIATLSSAMLDLVAALEASLDFPEEGYHFADRADVSRSIARMLGEIEGLLADATSGCLLRDGATVVIAGRPNTGKSSIFNALLRMERAIVSAEAGTTRDLLLESFDLNGVPVTLVDTAGRRLAADGAEAEGVRRAETAAAHADLELLVLDGSSRLAPEDGDLLAQSSRRRLVVLNKSDLPAAIGVADMPGCPAVRVSALTGAGVADLVVAMAGALGSHPPDGECPRVTNARHVERLACARDALGRAQGLVIAGSAEELVLEELNASRAALEEVTGARTPDDVLARIFERFCVGK